MKTFIALYIALAGLLLASTTALAQNTLRAPTLMSPQAQIHLPRTAAPLLVGDVASR